MPRAAQRVRGAELAPLVVPARPGQEARRQEPGVGPGRIREQGDRAVEERRHAVRLAGDHQPHREGPQPLRHLARLRGLPGLARGQRVAQEPNAVLAEPEVEVGVPHRGQEARANVRILAEAHVDASRTVLQEGARGDGLAAGLIGAGGAEELDEEIGHLPGGLRLPPRGLFGTHGAPEPDARRDPAGHDRQEHERRRGDPHAMAPRELPHPVERVRRRGQDRLVREVPAEIGRELARGRVAAVRILLQRAHHDPLQLALQVVREPPGIRGPPLRDRRGPFRLPRQARGRRRRVLLADHAHRLQQRAPAQAFRVERKQPGQQLVEHDPQRVDVRARVHGARASRLLGAHRVERPHDHPLAGHHGPRRLRIVHRLGDAEVDHLGNRHPVADHDQHVGRLEIPVDHPLLVRVLDRVAHRGEQLHAPPHAHPLAVAERVDRLSGDVLHDEVGTPGVGRGRFEHLGDAGMIHQGQRLPFHLEARENLTAVHAGLDHLERDAAADGLPLLGEVDDAEAPLPQRLQEPVRADRPEDGVGVAGGEEVGGRGPLQEAVELRAQAGLPGELAVQERPALRVRQLVDGVEQAAQPHPPLLVHRRSPDACRPDGPWRGV
jgi:hypothetical protein